VNGRCQVKAAGGIRELPELLEYLRAGARRFGSTRTDQFVRAFEALPEEQQRSITAASTTSSLNPEWSP